MEKKYLDLTKFKEKLQKMNVTLVETSSAAGERRVKGPDLTDEEVDKALTSLLKEFPMIERVWADPVYQNQRLFLMSFVPSIGATPNPNGVFGYVKVRGVFENSIDLENRAEYIIRNCDSYHTLYQGIVGQPCPVTMNFEKFSREVKEIDIKKDAAESVSQAVKEAREKERKDVEDVKKRENELLKRTSENKTDPFDTYTELMVKRANMIFAVLDVRNKVKQFKKNLRATIRKIELMDDENKEYAVSYLDRYKNACKEAGIEEKDNVLLKYMVGKVPFSIESHDENEEENDDEDSKEKQKKITYTDGGFDPKLVLQESGH